MNCFSALPLNVFQIQWRQEESIHRRWKFSLVQTCTYTCRIDRIRNVFSHRRQQFVLIQTFGNKWRFLIWSKRRQIVCEISRELLSSFTLDRRKTSQFFIFSHAIEEKLWLSCSDNSLSRTHYVLDVHTNISNMQFLRIPPNIVFSCVFEPFFVFQYFQFIFQWR